MSRNISAGVAAAIDSEVYRQVVFVRIDLPSGLILVHSGVGELTIGSDVYLGVGNFGQISEVRESESIAPYKVTATLSGIPQEFISEAVGQHYQGSDAIIYRGFLDENHDLIASPTISFRGRVDYADIQMGETASVQLVIQSRLADWSRPRIRRYTHEDQQLRYPGDMGFEFVAQMVEKQIVWGR